MIPSHHSLTITFLATAAFTASAAEPLETIFHAGSGTNKPAWDQKMQKRLENCTLDYQAVLHGKNPVYAQPDPAKDSTATDQFYKADGYDIHVVKNPVVLGGVSGFIYGPMIDLDSDVIEGEMHSILHTAFYTADQIKRGEFSGSPFPVPTGKDKPGWSEKTQKNIAACTADYAAVIDGKKPAHAKPATAQDSHFFKGDGYQIDIIEASVTVGGVRGFLYGPMLDLGPELSGPGETESIFHITFYTADELEKLRGKK